MQTPAHIPAELVVAAGLSVPAATVETCPILAAAKAKIKAMKKIRKHEQRRVFMGLCASFHALGFSF
jgi:hypothetical protein